MISVTDIHDQPRPLAAQPHPSRPRRERFLVFGAPCLGDEEKREIIDCLDTGWIGTGPKVAQFEEAFRQFKSAPHAVAVGSCTAALHLSLLAADLGPDAEVITSAMTFCATVNAILHAGARPVLADIDPRTMNLDPLDVERLITPRTRAIMPVHFAGRPCPMDELEQLAARHHLVIIEDCAHAIESRIGSRPTGTIGAFGCFSFYVTKNMTTGEGGMVLCRDADAAARIKRLALHGMSQDAWRRYSDRGYRHYEVVEAGFKYNMMDLQAALGLHQLKRLDAGLARRNAVWARYDEAFKNLPVTRPAPEDANTIHARHLYTLLIDEATSGMTRDAFLESMTEEKIGVGVHYRSLPEHPYYQRALGVRPTDYPHALDVGRRTVSLPLSAGISDDDASDVIASVQRVLGR